MVIISKLNASLQEFGDTIVYKNILNIEEILVEAKDTKILEDTDVYIFQSKNAAIISKRYIQKFNKNSQFLAVGIYTAKAVRDNLGVRCTFPENNYSSKDLLNSEYLKATKNKKVAILKGENGLSILSQKLQESNQVHEIIVYKRTINKSAIVNDDFKKDCKNVVLCMSNSILDYIIENFRDTIHNTKVQLIVPNKRFITDKTNVFDKSYVIDKIDDEIKYMKIFEEIRENK